jgi:ubiquinone/menaquinone biosynthesis C-methylase UbiE
MAGEGSILDKTSRITRSRQQARESYNRMSRFYGLLSGGSEKRVIETAIEGFLKPRAGEKILEPGFGAGQVLVTLAEAVGEEGRVYGIDISEGMMAATRKRFERRGLSGRAELIRGDAAELPFEEGFFDGIFMSFALELFDAPEIPVVLGECMRVLKDGGRLCVACMSDRGRHGLMMKLYLWSHEKFPNLVDCRPIFARGFIEEAGFEVDGHKVMSMWGLPVEIVLARKGG